MNMTKVKNFARFYACLNSVQTADKEALKESLVVQFTSGRTSSLREMTSKEYTAMCDSIDPKMDQTLREKSEIKTHRSAVLRRLQLLGVDTTDWNAVDSFCLNRRIAGKQFFHLTVEELKAMIPKLIAIAKKPKNKKPTAEQEHQEKEISTKQMGYLMSITPKNKLLN